MIKKVMISQQMSGLTHEQISAVREKAMKWIGDNGYDFINSYFPDYNNEDDETIIHKNVDYLGRAISTLGKADILYMCKGWEDARGCRVEKFVAETYDIEIIYEED